MNWTEQEYEEYQKRRGINVSHSPKVKRQKYHNEYTWKDGICFHSSKEARRYYELKLRFMAGDIAGFCRQPEFVLVEGNETDRAVTYKADFIILNNDGTFEIEDVKGYESQQWERTYKLFRLKYPNLKLNVIKE